MYNNSNNNAQYQPAHLLAQL